MAGVESADRRFRALYDAHGSSVLTYFKRRTESETAQDCAAETFLVAWRRIDEVPPCDEALPWLYGVARRVLANHSRSGSRMGRLMARLAGLRSDSPANPETVVLRRAEEAALVDAVNRLRPNERELLLLATWEELPHAQIGESLGCSAHAIDQRIHRAVRHLARELAATGQRASGATIRTTELKGGQ
jgi:RNA polymerase sigma-70 factor (ECF subfamily)